MDRLGLADLFDGVFHIASADFVPKPDPASLRTAGRGARHRARATTAFFEDRAMNLAPAAALGMTTVLVGADAEANADPSCDTARRGSPPSWPTPASRRPA